MQIKNEIIFENVNVGRFVGCLGPSKISKASLSNFFEYFLLAQCSISNLN